MKKVKKQKSLKMNPFQRFIKFLIFIINKAHLFYKKSEFNRGLSIGLVMSLLVIAGYSAKAAIPSASNLPHKDSLEYGSLFPANYIKSHNLKWFHYIIDETNGNTTETGETQSGSELIVGDNDLLLVDDKANPTLNLTFFTHKINNPSKVTSINDCKAEYDDNDQTYCGAYLSLNHTFYKHLVFAPEQRLVNTPNHMYFYNNSSSETITFTVENKPSNSFHRNANTGNQNQNTAFLDNLYDFFDIKKALAVGTPAGGGVSTPHATKVTPPNNGFVIETIGEPQEEKYLVTGKISDMVSSGLLDGRVFKPISYLNRSENYSYIYEGLTAEPIGNFSNATPEEYSDGTLFISYFNTHSPFNDDSTTANNGVSAEIENYYKIQGSKLMFVNNWKYNAGWQNVDSGLRWVAEHSGPTTAKVTFYNNHVENYVTFEKEFKDHLSFDGSPGSSNYHLFVYEGNGSTGLSMIDSITMYIGNPTLPNMKKTGNGNSISYYDDEGILNIFFPKAKAASGSNSQNSTVQTRSTVLSDYFGEFNTDLETLVALGYLPSEMFQPHMNFIDRTGKSKSYLYYQNDIFDWDTDLSANAPGAAQNDLISNYGIVNKDFNQFLTYQWVDNAVEDSLILPGYKDPEISGGIIMISPFSYDLKHAITGFKFSPNNIGSTTPGEALFMSSSDTNTYNNSTVGGSKALGVNVKLKKGSTVLANQTIAMTNYLIDFRDPFNTNTANWNWIQANGGSALGNTIVLELNLIVTGGVVKDTITIPITVESPSGGGACTG